MGVPAVLDRDPALRTILPTSFPDLLAALYAEKYTGALTLHFVHGQPTVVEVLASTQIRLVVPPRT